jgi:hypothetical protein
MSGVKVLADFKEDSERATTMIFLYLSNTAK